MSKEADPKEMCERNAESEECATEMVSKGSFERNAAHCNKQIQLQRLEIESDRHLLLLGSVSIAITSLQGLPKRFMHHAWANALARERTCEHVQYKHAHVFVYGQLFSAAMVRHHVKSRRGN